ncbi:MAG TPA: hypothetical protein VFN44_12700 [Solirubrobacteraceae bacterium]|nr:hypothetical protein [Solirubrobacteraceae bacterium]
MATRDITGARHALLSRLIDHAALFPPASLPTDAAVEVDRAARATPEAWILHRFLVPASRLAELPAGFDPPLGVIVDVDALPPLSEQVDVVEARLDRAATTDGVGARVFLEVWPGDDDKLDAVAERGAGAKVRCGGATPDMFPSPWELAHFVCGCRDRGLAFKATAGLHHPLRDGIVHGFLNLLGAAVLAHAGGAAPRELVEVLLEQDARAFAVTDDAFTVRGQAFGADDVAATRERLFVGYGSCSFSEPVEDLRGMRIL